MPWPVLNHYEGDSLRQVAFPLGGIGTGTISLGGRAELRDFEIFNTPAKGSNPPFTFFALWCRPAGGAAVTRILEGELRPPYDGAFGATTPLAGLPRLRHVSLDACYPFARYTLGDPDLPVTVELEAFNPLIPLDADSSGLPLAVLRYTLRNETGQSVEAAIAGSVLNYIGSDLFAYGSKSFGMRNFGPGKQMGGNVNEARRCQGRRHAALRPADAVGEGGGTHTAGWHDGLGGFVEPNHLPAHLGAHSLESPHSNILG